MKYFIQARNFLFPIKKATPQFWKAALYQLARFYFNARMFANAGFFSRSFFKPSARALFT